MVDSYMKLEPSVENPAEFDQCISDEIDQALLSFEQFHHQSAPSYSSSSPDTIVFDSSPETSDSLTSNEDNGIEKLKNETPINYSTIASIKRSMIDTSKLISTFTTLKTTYLKLCKEFNYLLNKFNENERIKIELINENNELKSLLTEIITKRELERKEYRKLQLQ